MALCEEHCVLLFDNIDLVLPKCSVHVSSMSQTRSNLIPKALLNELLQVANNFEHTLKTMKFAVLDKRLMRGEYHYLTLYGASIKLWKPANDFTKSQRLQIDSQLRKAK